MKADIVTIFPDFFRGPLDYGITRRAQEMGLAKIEVHDLREFTHDRHRTVDDRPFGGGEGMVLKPEPLFECLESMGLAPREERLARTSEAVGSSALGARATVYAESCGGVGVARPYRSDLRPVRRRG